MPMLLPALAAALASLPLGAADLTRPPTGQTSCSACIVTMTGERTFSAPRRGTIRDYAAVLSGPGQAALVVLRPLPGLPTTFTVVSRSPRVDAPLALHGAIVMAPTRQAVRAGDALGIELLRATVLTTTLPGVKPTVSTSPDADPGQTTHVQQSQTANELLAAATLRFRAR